MCIRLFIKKYRSTVLEEAIMQVRDGKQVIDKQLQQPLQEYIINEKKQSAQKPSLSRREKEMLELIVNGYTSKEIAAKLFLGQRTIDTYRYNLTAKLNVKNTTALVQKTLDEQLLRK